MKRSTLWCVGNSKSIKLDAFGGIVMVISGFWTGSFVVMSNAQTKNSKITMINFKKIIMNFSRGPGAICDSALARLDCEFYMTK